MSNVELLAPAGSYESMTAAIAAGADAVYMGGMKFGARAYAENGDEQTMLDAIRYVHLHDKKFYLTVNTLLKERELQGELYDYLAPLYEAGMDAVIVQDMGVLSFVKKYFPGLHIHASTQMTVTGPAGAALLERLGCSRVVTARELSLKELAAIRQATDMEIESFVHGALCYCYSGQCLMSSLFGGRSGNRGRCAQPCRLPYEVYAKGRRLGGENSRYVLSLKDMCTAPILPDILRAGVTSLKIEGRMKKPEYTAGVVRIYRKYLDLCQANPTRYRVEEEDMQELFDLYNRDGFHTGYYRDKNGPAMMAFKNEKAQSGQKSRNEALFQKLRREYVEKKNPIRLDGCLKLHMGKPARLQAGGVTVQCGMVEQAARQPLSKERVEAQMRKTGGTPYEFGDLDIQMDDTVFLPMQILNELRRQTLEQVTAEKLRRFLRVLPEKSKKEGLGPLKNVKKQHNTKNVPDRLQVSVESLEQLEVALGSPVTDKIYAAASLFTGSRGDTLLTEAAAEAQAVGKHLYLALPHIVRKDTWEKMHFDWEGLIERGLSGYLVRNLEGLAFLTEKNLQSYATTDANLYTYNQEAQQFYENLGVCCQTAPLELNSRELAKLENQNNEIIVYGYLPLMISAQCLNKNLRKCDKNSDVLTLQDRYKKNFCVKCVCDFCYNIIYNSVPLSLEKEAVPVSELGFLGLRLSFTMEDAKQMQRVLSQFADAFLKEKTEDIPGEKGTAHRALPKKMQENDAFTKGHFKRGVE